MESLNSGYGRLDVCRSTSDFVCDALRKAVWNHSLAAGERLVEAKVAKSLNVSITPVRQAFTLLTKEGLLIAFPYKGTYVRYITKEYCDDIMLVRKQLESAAFDLAFASITEDDIQYLIRLCKQSDAYYQKGDRLEAVNYDIQFHEFFIGKAGSPLMLEMWNLLKNRIIVVQTYTKMVKFPKDYLYSRHEGIIQTLKERKKKDALTTLLEHLDTSILNYGFISEKEVEYK